MSPSNTLLSILLFPVATIAAAASTKPVSIDVKAHQITGPFIHIARFFGADEPNYAYFPQGKALLADLGSLGSAQTYFRTHNLLTTGDGTPGLKWGSTNAYTEDKNGNPIYNFTIIDRIFDAYLENNVKPYAQIGFMPEALSTHPYPYQFNFSASSSYNNIYTGWTNPPTSYDKWAELVYRWVTHCVERYGRAEVNSWYWEVWNEPNIPYWNGTTEEFYMLYDYAVDAVKRALPTARIGGFEIAGGPAGTYLGDFLDHVLKEKSYATGKTGTRPDFLSFHAKGAPNFINDTHGGGYVQMGISAQLQNIDDAFGVIASYPEVRQKPIVISECDPDGCAACITPQYGYRNGLHYPAFTAASFVRALDLSVKHGVNVQGALTWAFEYDDFPYFDGFRVLSTNEIVKPVLNFHRMIGKMSGSRVEATSSGQIDLDTAVASGVRNSSDVGVLSSLDGGRLSVFIWHYHDNDVPMPDASISVAINGLPWSGKGKLTHYRVDNDHSNAYTVWLKQGSPQNPTPKQYAALKAAGNLATMGRPSTIKVRDGQAKLSLNLPIQALSLIVIEK
ncbi:family 39 glycoside hydrolase [Xylogone sp. PMI_703]|nr:family 39 glycoside hydrolase [Xylogone sp. PMI_703]